MKNLNNIVILILTVILISGCYNNKEELLYPGSTNPVDCNTVQAKFGADIFPLMTAKCAIGGCHDPVTAQGGVVFTNYAQISSKKDRIYTRAVIEKTMPANGPLLPDEVKKLKCWIEGGALNN